jgi:dUTP pyrophosphatase
MASSTMTHRLFLVATNPVFADLYKRTADTYNRTAPEERSSGFDLFTDCADQDPTYSAHATLVSQGCRAIAVGPHGPAGFWLAPRSSISKTPYRLANSLGLIDPTYRGVIKAAFDGQISIPSTTDSPMRLCQLVAPSLVPWLDVIVVDELPGPETFRGEGGFGSTGR